MKFKFIKSKTKSCELYFKDFYYEMNTIKNDIEKISVTINARITDKIYLGPNNIGT